jgi:hypothetical protein
MFDDLREPENEQQSFQDALGLGTVSSTVAAPAARARPVRGFLGLSAPQRLVLALLLLVAVCVLGSMCLLITGRISAF